VVPATLVIRLSPLSLRTPLGSPSRSTRRGRRAILPTSLSASRTQALHSPLATPLRRSTPLGRAILSLPLAPRTVSLRWLKFGLLIQPSQWKLTMPSFQKNARVLGLTTTNLQTIPRPSTCSSWSAYRHARNPVLLMLLAGC
jgi:hypothetical protein